MSPTMLHTDWRSKAGFGAEVWQNSAAWHSTSRAESPLDDRLDPGQIADQPLERRVPCADLPK
jgi:hypothetical protein